MVFHERPYFIRKLGMMSPNMSPAAVMIGALRLNYSRNILLLFVSWEIFHAFLSSADFFQNQLFRNTIKVSNSLDQDQA